MNISYYTFKKDEFETIKQVIKKEMQRIWGSHLVNTEQSLDDDEIFMFYFEEYQHLITVDSLNHDLKEASVELSVDQEKLAALIHKFRNGKYPFEIKKSSRKFWLQCYTDGYNKIENMVWLDASSIDELSVVKIGSERFNIIVSTIKGKSFRASKFSIPELLIEDTLQELIYLTSQREKDD